MGDSKYSDSEEFGEDDRTITMAAPHSQVSPSKLSGMGLDLSFAESRFQEDLEGEAIQESTVNVVFDFPDGSQGEGQFKLGHTVEYIKSYVEMEFGIPMYDQEFFIEDKRMLNPLSLLDFPESKGVDEIFVRVEGDMPSESKK